MRFKSESPRARLERVTRWHDWFAWYPVRIGEGVVWLETIEQKLECNILYYQWEYRYQENSNNGA